MSKLPDNILDAIGRFRMAVRNERAAEIDAAACQTATDWKKSHKKQEEAEDAQDALIKLLEETMYTEEQRLDHVEAAGNVSYDQGVLDGKQEILKAQLEALLPVQETLREHINQCLSDLHDIEHPKPVAPRTESEFCTGSKPQG